MRGRFLVCAVALSIPLAVACSSDYGDDNHTGERFNACYANGTCNAGLACIDGLCVLDAEGDGGGQVGEGGPSDASSSSVDAGDSGDVADGDRRLERIVSAVCALTARCNPQFYAAAYGKVPCEEVIAVGPPLAGTTPRTKAEVDSCLDRLAKATCLESSTPFALAECAQKPGTLKANSRCAVNEQCASGLCAIAQSGEICGVCTAARGEGQGCPIDGPTSCGNGLYCSKGKCVQMLALGAACSASPTSSDVCTFGAACIATTCQPARDFNEPCGASAECRVGLECTGAKCHEIAFRAVGQQCGFQQPPCARSNCLGGGDVGECVAYGTEGAACGGSVALCATGFRCDASTSKCVKGETPYDCK